MEVLRRIRPWVTVPTDMAQRFTPPTSTEPKAGGTPTPVGITDVPTGTGTILVVLMRHGTAPARPGGAGINRGGILVVLRTPGVLLIAVGDRPIPDGDRRTAVGVLLTADGDRLIPDGVLLTADGDRLMADGDRLMGFRTRGGGMHPMAGAVPTAGTVLTDGTDTPAIRMETTDSTAA